MVRRHLKKDVLEKSAAPLSLAVAFKNTRTRHRNRVLVCRKAESPPLLQCTEEPS